MLERPNNWKQPQQLYYSRITYPDIGLEENSNILQNAYNVNNICEWKIDGQIEYNIMTKLEQMTMVASVYRTTDQLSAHILVVGFTRQLKGWWDEHLSEEYKYNIFHSIKTSLDGTPITQDGKYMR